MIKIFAHRGFTFDENNPQNKIDQNSIASLKNAVDHGFKAIEFDIWYFNSQLILCHDQPSLSNYQNFTKFDEYFIYGNQLDYWLDFKNLDETNIDNALTLMKSQINFAKINLDQIYFAPYCTDYLLSQKIFYKFKKAFGNSIKFVAIADKAQQIPQIYEFVKNNNINFISINYKIIDKNLIDKFQGKEFLAWSVNDQSILDNLGKIGVKYFASDKILPNLTI
jgi:glycerophosphoryl diester phosphodiesterase